MGPLVAALGAILLIVSLFLDWYEDRTGFTVFEVLDLVLVGLALVIIASLAGGMGLVRQTVTPGTSLLVAVLTVLTVASQIVNHPPAAVGGVDKDLGIWLALSGAAVMLAGAVLATMHISLHVEPRERGRRPARADDATTRAEPARGERPLTDPPAEERPGGTPPGPERP